MRLVLLYQPAAPAGVCPYRLLDEENHEIVWVNDFLDAQHLRQLSPRSVRAYAYDLLHFARWFQSQHQTLSEITESTLLNYVRHQLSQQPQPTPQTINHRLTVIRCLYRFHHGQEISAGPSHFQRMYTTRCPVGYGARIAPLLSVSGSNNHNASSSLSPQSRLQSFGRVFVLSVTWQSWV
jgi:Phage integrase, N-terminal SAM-like domain